METQRNDVDGRMNENKDEAMKKIFQLKKNKRRQQTNKQTRKAVVRKSYCMA